MLGNILMNTLQFELKIKLYSQYFIFLYLVKKLQLFMYT